MDFLAAATSSAPTATERLSKIPTEFWVKLSIAVFGLIALVIVLRKVAKINKVILGVTTIILVSSVGFYWIYDRNEPAWATPAVEWLAGFFPSKGRKF